MSAERKKDGRKLAPTAARKPREARHPTTPESATSLEKERLDDEAVENAVTVTETPTGTHSVLPSPPIPPNEQKKVREGMVTVPETQPVQKAGKKKSRRAPG